MTSERGDLTNPQRRLPDLALPRAPGGEPFRLRAPGRRSPLLVLVHGAGCAACGEFVARLEAEGDSIEEWDGRPLVIAPEDLAKAGDLGRRTSLPVLADPERRLGSALSLGPPAVVVADQCGEVHEIHEAGEDHRFPEPDAVVAWLRYVAIQCPECQGEAF
jgi:hypothetical protein